MKKYELTNETKTIGVITTLYRICALCDFGNVKTGDLGGFVESESNLSHDGLCWIYDDACAYDLARVYENAKILNNVRVYNDACVFENAVLYDSVRVFGRAHVCGNSRITDDARIF